VTQFGINQGKIKNPTSIEELPEDLHQKIEAKFTANLQAFLAGCIKDQQGKVTQYREPIFGDPNVSASATLDVKINEEVQDPYPTHSDYANMLQDQRMVIDNSLITAVNMIMSCFDRLEGKTADYVDISADESPSKHPQYGMPFNFYDNQSMYAAANKTKLAALVTETNKTNLGGLVLLCE